MNTAARIAPPPAPPTPRPEVRQAVKALLTGSPAFARLPAATQQQIARDTALIPDYLAAPEGIPADRVGGDLAARALADGDPGPQEQDYGTARTAVDAIGKDKFQASSAREGAKVAGLLMKQVNFPTFVASLIQGVFQAIVKSSIEQMEAYSTMIASVAKSLQQFGDDNVTENQGRDHMVEKFPDLFAIGTDDFSDSPGPRLQLREGVEEGAALARVNSQLSFEDGQLKSMDLSDENVEKALVIAARTQLARQRQQLMASLVLMGINRIVVTDGKISAKILYDFQARDTRSLRRSASAYDFARDQSGNIQSTWAGEGTYEGNRKVTDTYDRSDGSVSSDNSSESYAKGTYKYEQRPIMTAMSAASEANDAVLSTRAQLAGNVEVNFKSDYLPLDKMATPGMIAAIQGNSTPVDPNVMPSARNPQTAGQTGQTPGQTQTTPAAAQTPAPAAS
jgi:hypothetical protein